MVTCVGGRLVYLESCVNLIIKSGGTEGDTCESITRTLFSRELSRQASMISKGIPKTLIVMSELITHNSASPHRLLHNASDKNKMDQVIQEMIAKTSLDMM